MRRSKPLAHDESDAFRERVVDHFIRVTDEPTDPKTCRRGIPTCYCAVGWPYDKQCPDCRDNWGGDSYCICPPPEGK